MWSASRPSFTPQPRQYWLQKKKYLRIWPRPEGGGTQRDNSLDTNDETSHEKTDREREGAVVVDLGRKGLAPTYITGTNCLFRASHTQRNARWWVRAWGGIHGVDLG